MFCFLLWVFPFSYFWFQHSHFQLQPRRFRFQTPLFRSWLLWFLQKVRRQMLYARHEEAGGRNCLIQPLFLLKFNHFHANGSPCCQDSPFYFYFENFISACIMLLKVKVGFPKFVSDSKSSVILINSSVNFKINPKCYTTCLFFLQNYSNFYSRAFPHFVA